MKLVCCDETPERIFHHLWRRGSPRNRGRKRTDPSVAKTRAIHEKKSASSFVLLCLSWETAAVYKTMQSREGRETTSPARRWPSCGVARRWTRNTVTERNVRALNGHLKLSCCLPPRDRSSFPYDFLLRNRRRRRQDIAPRMCTRAL